ncbi:MAG TPA: LysR family transcriptional regulator [Bauldia sp.]|jgi:molybdate transport repressor ModE-like protein
MNFTLRQVRYFVAVAESGSISGAARQLSVSQSAVTEAVKELEGDLGALLLERSGRGVTLTHRGQVFLRHANRILETVADAGRTLPGEDSPAGELHLGASSVVAGYILADLLARFRRAFPAVTVDAFEDSPEYLEHLLVNGELDVAVMVVSRLRQTAALETSTIVQSAYRLWLPLGHPLASARTVSLADIAAAGQIMLSLDEIQETAEAFWREHGLRPTVAFRTRSVEAVRSLVATGAGIAVLPDLVYRPWSLEGDRIEARPMVEQMPPVRVGVVWRRGSPLSKAATRFLDVVLPRGEETA